MHASKLVFLALGLTAACSSEEQRSSETTPYRVGQALTIGDEDGDRLMDVNDDCDTAPCAAVRERCGDEAYADVVLDDDAEVVDVVCFKRNVNVVELGEDPVDSASAGNNTVLVLDGEDDGVDVEGDVTLAGNNAVVYGQGADVSVIGGTLAIEKNNAIVRGVTVRGDVTIDKNNAKLLFVTIEGGLTILGNNTTLAASRVLGEITILGNNTVLVQNELGSAGPIDGKNLRCNGNVRIEADEADAGAPLSAAAGASVQAVACVGDRTGNGEPRD
ncbi:MAG: hypothetical protein ABW217_02555 [Polyangiaceae bacterium]